MRSRGTAVKIPGPQSSSTSRCRLAPSTQVPTSLRSSIPPLMQPNGLSQRFHRMSNTSYTVFKLRPRTISIHGFQSSHNCAKYQGGKAYLYVQYGTSFCLSGVAAVKSGGYENGERFVWSLCFTWFSSLIAKIEYARLADLLHMSRLTYVSAIFVVTMTQY